MCKECAYKTLEAKGELPVICPKVESEKPKSSYHDKIQEVARAVETQRAAIYDKSHKETIVWTENQLEYLYAAIYKLLRVKNQTRSKVKALDDILDAYNYCALLYEDL